jgi:outer membrane protein assembly factor BamB
LAPGVKRELGRLAIVVGVTLVLAVPSPAGDWPRYGGGDLVTNNVPTADAAGLSTATVSDLVTRWSANVGGRFVASPLYAEDVPFGARREDAIFVATNAGTVAALRASDGSVLWKRQVSGTSLIPACGITYGISSTPVLDRARGRLYAIGADGLLHALSLATGEEVSSNWPVRIIQLAGAEYVWGGLTLRGARVYVPVASYCDKQDVDGYFADGRLVAVDVADARIVASFDVVEGPNNMGGIWGYAGVSVDPETGHLFTATANTWVYDPECGCIIETGGYGEAALELDADLKLVSWNRPEDVGNREDSGFGAAPLLFQPSGCQPLAAANAKNGRVYVWSRGDLGAGPIWSARVGPSGLDESFLAQPSYSPELEMFFISAARDYDDEGAVRTFDAVVGFKVGPGCRFPERPTWTAPGVGRGPKSPPLVVGDLVFVPGGFDRNAFALDARTGEVLWKVGLSGAALAPIAYARDEVLVADSAGILHAFGLPRPVGVGKQGLYAI